MDIRKVKKLIDLLSESGMAEIEIKEGDDSVRIVRHNDAPTASTPQIIQPPIATQIPQKPPISTATEMLIDNENSTIVSPMVGTFYSKSAPNAKPFISIGQLINKGDVVCIIEAMKIMNKIEADNSGVVKEIKVVDGDAVEFGQALIILE